MTFDAEKFETAIYKTTEAVVETPELKMFFDEDEKPEFVVRGLTGTEIAEAREAQKQNKVVASLLENLLSPDVQKQVEGIKEAIGLSSDASPDDYIYRISCLKNGAVRPLLTQSQVVKLATVQGIMFYVLTNKILELTGEGQTLGE